MKEFFKHNRGAAIGALVLTIIICIPLGVFRTVMTAKAGVESSFAKNDERYGCVKADLEDYLSYAFEIYAVCSAEGLDTEGLNSAMSELRSSLTDPTSISSAYKKLSEEARLVYRTMVTKDDSSSGTKTVTLNYYDMIAIEDRLSSNSDYVSSAKYYNKVINSFPASLLRFGMKEAETFGN